MKSLQRLCAAVVLTLALTFSAFAGDIQIPPKTDPPPPTPVIAQGEIQIPAVSETTSGEAGAVDPMTEIALNLLLNVLSLL